jgi:hypothetical protein
MSDQGTRMLMVTLEIYLMDRDKGMVTGVSWVKP